MEICTIIQWWGASTISGDVSIIASALLALPLYFRYENYRLDRSIVDVIENGGDIMGELEAAGIFESSKHLFMIYFYYFFWTLMLCMAIYYFPFSWLGVSASAWVFFSFLTASIVLVARGTVLNIWLKRLGRYTYYFHLKFANWFVGRLDNYVFWLGVLFLGLSWWLSRFAPTCVVPAH